MTLSEIVYTSITWGVPLILSFMFHEMGHGYMAWILGDDTAKEKGRLTLNPMAHIDWVGSVILPSALVFFSAPFLVGWGKPVLIDYGMLKHPRRDMGLIALSGFAANFIVAILLVLIEPKVLSYIDVTTESGMLIQACMHNTIICSLVVGIFNLLPILPLDGGKFLLTCLPLKLAQQYQRTEPFGIFIILSIIFVLPQIMDVNFVHWFITTIFPYLYRIVNLFGV